MKIKNLVISISLLLALIGAGVGGTFAAGVWSGGSSSGQSQWGYFGASGGGMWPSETSGGDDGAAIEFTGTATTTLWLSSADLSVVDTPDYTFEWFCWLPADYKNGSYLSDIKLYWITDDTTVSNDIDVTIYAKAIGDGDASSGAYSASINSNPDFQSGGANILNIDTFTSSLLPSNSPQRGDLIVFKIFIDDSECTVDNTLYLALLTFKYARAQ